ncbi:MAG: aspartyl protease family protein [Gemmatimonadota bacterium]|nr:aspartyl protease family protein [Gemmatimonadota bacterium]
MMIRISGTVVAMYVALGLPSGLAGSMAVQSRTGPLEGELIEEVDLAHRGGWLSVVARVPTGDSLELVLDTGANADGFGLATVHRLRLERVAAGRVFGAGDSERVWLVSGPPIRLGAAGSSPGLRVLLDDEFLTHPSGMRYDGLLGTGLLRRYDVLIDVPSRRLALYRSGTAAPSGGPVVPVREAVSFDPLDCDLIGLRVLINGRWVDAILDSGAPDIIVNRAAAALADVPTGDELYLHSRGIGDEGSGGHRTRLASVEIGRTAFDGLDAIVSDLPIFTRLGQADRPAAIIGVSLIERCAILVEWRTRRLRLCESPVPSPVAGDRTAARPHDAFVPRGPDR